MQFRGQPRHNFVFITQTKYAGSSNCDSLASVLYVLVDRAQSVSYTTLNVIPWPAITVIQRLAINSISWSVTTMQCTTSTSQHQRLDYSPAEIVGRFRCVVAAHDSIFYYLWMWPYDSPFWYMFRCTLVIKPQLTFQIMVWTKVAKM